MNLFFRGANFVIFFEMRKFDDDIWHNFSFLVHDGLYLYVFYSFLGKKTMKWKKNVGKR